MIIKRRPIITWLLKSKEHNIPRDITFVVPSNVVNYDILNRELKRLNEVRTLNPEWGLPELVTSSFRKVMEKNTPAFINAMPTFFENFSETEECGILIDMNGETLVYGFGDNQLNVWFFKEQNGQSLFMFAAECEFVDGKPKLLIPNSILYDDNLLIGTTEHRKNEIGLRMQFIAIYVAVKKYIKVETVVIPQGVFTEIDWTPLEYIEKKRLLISLVNRL